VTRAQALAAGKAVMHRPGAGTQLRHLAIAYADSVLDLDLRPSPVAQRRERRLRRLLTRALGGES
jgi:hypothetical protein